MIMVIIFAIQQFSCGKNQNYFWKRDYSIKPPLGNIAYVAVTLHKSSTIAMYFPEAQSHPGA